MRIHHTAESGGGERPARASLRSVPSRNPALSSPEEIIDEARNGRMFILVDDEDRENEGDLVIPAQMATPEKINFMAMHGRGLICLALSKKRVDELGLDLMSPHNGTRHETAFTVSIEARDGVTTGISAADRARTVAVAIDSSKSREEIVTPGHIFPLVARDGGVLVRAGHTEAAVDVSRLAGLNPSGVICEIMNEDGTMARLDDLIAFAQFHNIKIGTIRDLIAYRRRGDRLVQCVATLPIESHWGGAWTALTYRNLVDGSEHLVLRMGEAAFDEPTLVRMHVLSLFSDIYSEVGARSGLLERAMRAIGEAGQGVIVILNPPRHDMLSRIMQSRRAEGGAERHAVRDYGVGAQILTDLGISDMILLSNSGHHDLVAIEGHGLRVVDERRIDIEMEATCL